MGGTFRSFIEAEVDRAFNPSNQEDKPSNWNEGVGDSARRGFLNSENMAALFYLITGLSFVGAVAVNLGYFWKLNLDLIWLLTIGDYLNSVVPVFGAIVIPIIIYAFVMTFGTILLQILIVFILKVTAFSIRLFSRRKRKKPDTDESSRRPSKHLSWFISTGRLLVLVVFVGVFGYFSYVCITAFLSSSNSTQLAVFLFSLFGFFLTSFTFLISQLLSRNIAINWSRFFMGVGSLTALLTFFFYGMAEYYVDKNKWNTNSEIEKCHLNQAPALIPGGCLVRIIERGAIYRFLDVDFAKGRESSSRLFFHSYQDDAYIEYAEEEAFSDIPGYWLYAILADRWLPIIPIVGDALVSEIESRINTREGKKSERRLRRADYLARTRSSPEYVQAEALYSKSEEIAAKVVVSIGDRIAVIGDDAQDCGRLFSDRVADNGIVYAIEFDAYGMGIARINARTNGIKNCIPIWAQWDSIALPDESVDIVFMMDTILWMPEEKREAFLRSIHSALRPNGSLYVVERSLLTGEGVGMVENAPKGLDKIILSERISSYGFSEGEELPIPGLETSFMLRFVRE